MREVHVCGSNAATVISPSGGRTVFIPRRRVVSLRLQNERGKAGATSKTFFLIVAALFMLSTIRMMARTDNTVILIFIVLPWRAAKHCLHELELL